MASKLAMFIQGLLLIVVLISSMGEARNLVEVAAKQNDVDNVKYCAKTSLKDKGDSSSDCFIPGFPGIPGIPNIPGFPDMPGFPGIPGWPGTPSTPNTPASPSPSTTPETPDSPAPSPDV